MMSDLIIFQIRANFYHPNLQCKPGKMNITYNTTTSRAHVSPDSSFIACQYVCITASSTNVCIPVEIHPDPTTPSNTISIPKWISKVNKSTKQFRPMNITTTAAAIELTLQRNSILLNGTSSKITAQCHSIFQKFHGLPIVLGCLIAARHLGQIHTFQVTRVEGGNRIMTSETQVEFVPYDPTSDVSVSTIDHQKQKENQNKKQHKENQFVIDIPAFETVRQELNLLVHDAVQQKTSTTTSIVPHGIILSGVVGCGKSTLIRQMCQYVENKHVGIVTRHINCSTILEEMQTVREKNEGNSQNGGVPQLDTILTQNIVQEKMKQKQTYVVVLDNVDLLATSQGDDDEGDDTGENSNGKDPAVTRGTHGDAFRYIVRFCEKFIKQQRGIVIGIANTEIGQLSKTLRRILTHHISLPSLDIISRTVIVHGLFNNNNNDHDNNDNHNTDTDNDNGNGMEWKHVVERTGGYIMSDFIRLLRHVELQNGKNEKNETKEKNITNLPECVEKSLDHIRPSSLSALNVRVPTISFNDIGGYDDVKQRLRKTVEWQWSRRDAMSRMGVSATSGVLLHGPTGCGKTTFAEALAYECRCNFVSVRLHDIFSAYLGESERYLRTLFRTARRATPCMLFLDDLDVIAAKRNLEGGSGSSGGSGTVSGRVLATLLNEMDGIESNEGVVVVGATNSKEDVDPALLRPGRLDVDVLIRAPVAKDREEMFLSLTKSTPLSNDVDVQKISEMTEGWNGATMTLLCSNAALYAMREKEHPEFVAMHHYLAAIEEERLTERNPEL